MIRRLAFVAGLFCLGSIADAQPVDWLRELPEPVRTALARQAAAPAGTRSAAVLVNRLQIMLQSGALQFESRQVLLPGASGGVMRLPHPRAHGWSAVRLGGEGLERGAALPGARLEETDAGTFLVLPFAPGEGAVLLQRGGRRAVMKEFFHGFEPFFSAATLYADIDVDAGRPLSWQLDAALGRIEPEIAGTRYRFRFSQNPLRGTGGGPLPMLHLATETGQEAVAAFFRTRFYAPQRALDEWVERMSGNYSDGLGRTNLQAAYIYDALLGESLSLNPGLLPEVEGWGIVTGQAELVRRFTRFLGRLGVMNAVVIPLLDGEDCRPVGSPGVLVRFDDEVRWYFPENFHSPPNHIPLALRGRPCLLVDGVGGVSRTVLPDPAGEQDRIHISLTGTLSRAGALAFTLRSTLSGEASIRLRELLDRLNEESLQQRLERMLLGSRPGYAASRFEIFHRRVLFHQPQILLRGRFAFPQERGLLRFVPLLPVRALEGEEAAWGPATGTSLRVRLVMDARARVRGMPRTVELENRFFRYSLSAKLLPVHVPRKPRNWTQARWRRYLRDNPPRRAPVLELARSYVPKLTPRDDEERRARGRALAAIDQAEASLAALRISR